VGSVLEQREPELFHSFGTTRRCDLNDQQVSGVASGNAGDDDVDGATAVSGADHDIALLLVGAVEPTGQEVHVVATPIFASRTGGLAYSTVASSLWS
jgi:hypothetical protein